MIQTISSKRTSICCHARIRHCSTELHQTITAESATATAGIREPHISMRLDDTLCHAPMAVNKSDNRARGHQSPTPNTNQCSETPNIEPAFDQLRCMTSDDGNDFNINAVNKCCVKIVRNGSTYLVSLLPPFHT